MAFQKDVWGAIDASIASIAQNRSKDTIMSRKRHPLHRDRNNDHNGEVQRRPPLGNNSRAHVRRTKERFYEKYIIGKGIDIGCSNYNRAISDNVDLYNDHQTGKLEVTICGDATYMKEIENETYDFVIASHILEHIVSPDLAIKNWYRILKPGGHLVICVPERDLFEFRTELPSYKNEDHKWYFKIDESDPPVTLSLKWLIIGCLKDDPSFQLEYIKVCSEGCDETPPKNPRLKTGRKKKRLRKPKKPQYPDGECQIEAVVKKVRLSEKD